MTRTLTTVLALALAVIVVAVTVQAQEPKPAKITHWVTGNVDSLDQNAKTFTLKPDKSRRGKSDYTFSVADPKLLADLKPGDHVQVGYDVRNKQMVAEEVTPQPSASPKK
jgi:Cu/Ag efflux protein CusF